MKAKRKEEENRALSPIFISSDCDISKSDDDQRFENPMGLVENDSVEDAPEGEHC